MSGTGAGYDLSTNTFSPDGRVFQVEYAQKAAEKGGTTIGIRCVDGVVLGVEKIITQKMLLPHSNRRIYSIDTHVGMTCSGLAADADKLANLAREEAQKYRDFSHTQVPGRVLNKRVTGEVHNYTLYWYLRPFGSSALMSTYDDVYGPELYLIEPVGTGYRYFACAIGKNKASARTELEKVDFKTITAKEAVYLIAKIIYKLHDEVKDKDFELELSWVCDESGRKHTFVPEDLRRDAIDKAIAEKEREEEGDDMQ